MTFCGTIIERYGRILAGDPVAIIAGSWLLTIPARLSTPFLPAPFSMEI